MISKNKSLLLVFFILAFILRLQKINLPLADWHSWRQADTASVSWRFYQKGIDPLHPKYHDLSSIPSGMDNPEGYRMVELPIFNILHSFLYQAGSSLNVLSFEGWGRMTSIIISLIGAGFFYLFLRKKTNQKIALASLAFYLFLPFNIFYQRAILPENLLVMSILGFLYFFDSYLNIKGKWQKTLSYLLALFFLSLSLLIKPISAFFVLPALVFVFKKYKFNFFKKIDLWFLVFIPFGLFLLWRWWINHYPEGIPAFTWLLNGNNIRFKPSFFRWIFGDRIARLIMGYWGVVFLSLSFVNEKKTKYLNLLYAWITGMLLYLFVIATGNVQHDYYQVVIMPVLSFMAGLGLVNLWRLMKENSLVFKLSLSAILLSFTFAFSWFFVRDYYNINHPEIVLAGKAVNSLLSSDAKIIAPYMGDTAFLYQTKRNGWPIGGGIEEKISMGANYYVSVNLDNETNDLIDKCQVVKQEDQFVIIKLSECQF